VSSMHKLLLIVPAVLLLAGCKDTVIVEDNGPTAFERERAMERCVGEILSVNIYKAPADIRIACTQAVYGGTQ
jgi:hypothetical protein